MKYVYGLRCIYSDECRVQDKLMSGLRVTLDTFLNPDTGSKNGRLKAELRTAAALLSLDTDLNLGGPVLQSAAVLGHKVELETKVIKRFPKISQSRRRPLLGPSPG